jgi:MarR family 2-MHQ and catechol resistance regulon transcriptional repressor
MAERKKRMSQRGKTLRAFGAYLELLDTAEMMRGRLRGQLWGFDLTVRGFRLLEILYRNGPTMMVVAAEKLLCSRQNLEFLSKPLEERGWVQRDLRPLRDEEQEVRIRSRKIMRHFRRQQNGHAVGFLRLTPKGEKFVGTIFPNHAKVVKSLMRVLDGREQETLRRLLQKLREGDVVKYFKEMRMWGEDEMNLRVETTKRRQKYG